MRAQAGRTWVRRGWLAVVVVLVTLAALRQVPYALRGEETTAATIGALLWIGVPTSCAYLGALVHARRPENPIGLLLLVPGVVAVDVYRPLVSAAEPPEHLTLPLFAGLWLDDVGWIFLILPIFLLLALFPTGRLLSPRWRWYPRLVVGMAAFMAVYGVFSSHVGPLDGSWSVANPIGFLPDVEASSVVLVLWSGLLLTATVGAVTAMTLRMRRATWSERQQLKGLLAAIAVLAVSYSLAVVEFSDQAWGETTSAVLTVTLPLAMLLIPMTIAVAIVRHGVLDIDLIIRRTVTYAVLTGLLAVLYGGLLLAAEWVARTLTGQGSTLAVVISTLVVTVAFRPLHARVQGTVRRRFFRGPYDADAVVAGFAAATRDETDLASIVSLLETAISESLHPRSMAVWSPASVRTTHATR